MTARIIIETVENFIFNSNYNSKYKFSLIEMGKPKYNKSINPIGQMIESFEEIFNNINSINHFPQLKDFIIFYTYCLVSMGLFLKKSPVRN